jgi:competence protein ComEA
VKGLGPKKAKLVVEYRQQHGDFKSVDDLTHVKGIGKKTLTRIEARKEVKLSTTSENP